MKERLIRAKTTIRTLGVCYMAKAALAKKEEEKQQLTETVKDLAAASTAIRIILELLGAEEDENNA